MPRHLLLHFRPDGDGGSGDGGGGTGESGSGSGTGTPLEGTGAGSGTQDPDLVPRSEAQAARNEAKNLRDRLKAAEKERDNLQAATLSDTQKAQKERDDALAKASAADIKVRNLSVQVLAGKIGIIDPEAASALLNWGEIDDPEDSKKVEKALRDLVKEKPWLLGNVAGGSDGGAGNGNGAQVSDMNSLIRGGFGVRTGT